MKIVIDISEERFRDIQRIAEVQLESNYFKTAEQIVANGTPLPKGHGFIAICDSDFPITEEVKQELKDTVFVGNEDCRYCFDITEIIETESEG